MTSGKSEGQLASANGHVRIGSKADIRVEKSHVRFTPKSGLGGCTRDVRFGSLGDIRLGGGGLSKIRSGVLSSRLRSDAYFSNRSLISSRADAGIDAWRGSMTIAWPR